LGRLLRLFRTSYIFEPPLRQVRPFPPARGMSNRGQHNGGGVVAAIISLRINGRLGNPNLVLG